MSTQPAARARLTLLGDARRTFDLDPARSYTIGRSHDADVCIDHASISRRHANLQPGIEGWRIVDLQSTNGTAVDDDALPAGASRALASGSEIALGEGAVRLLFEAVASAAPQPAEARRDGETIEAPKVRPGSRPSRATPESGMAARGEGAFHVSDVLPFLSRDRTVLKRSYVLPGLVTVVVLLALTEINAAGQDALVANDASAYLRDTSSFITLLGAYVVCLIAFALIAVTGRRQPFWIYLVVALFEGILLIPALFARIAGPFEAVALHFGNEKGGFDLGHLAYYVIGVGVPEEMTKMLPVVLVMLVAARRGARDPLDGIALGAISAATFAFIETVLGYVPNEIDAIVSEASSSWVGLGLGVASGVQLLIVRLLDTVGGHIAWSGYFGYALLLARSRRSWTIGLGAWALVAILHGTWDAAFDIHGHLRQLAVLFVDAALSFVLLFAAIRRGRRITGLSQPLRAEAAT